MASQPDESYRTRGLKLDTGNSSSFRNITDSTRPDGRMTKHRSNLKGSSEIQDHVRATPPMAIPTAGDNPAIDSSSNDDEEHSYMNHYMRARKTSISFNNEVRTDSGQRHKIEEPLRKSSDARSRGRSMMNELIIAQQKEHRSHSESNRDHFDPVTGRHLPQYSTSPPRDEPHVGEARFPFLQATVDEMARESRSNTPQATSLTTAATLSPKMDEVRTPPNDDGRYPNSPVLFSPISQHIATSYESTPSPRSFRRTASERWRNGEGAQDFFARAGSLRKGQKQTSWRDLARRDTNSSTKSPMSTASSFLKGFSLGSGDDDHHAHSAVDAEGQTIGDDYVIGKQIGFGGFSVIKEVTQLSPETGKLKKLAVKIVRRNIEGKSEAENDTAQAEFEHEVELWRFLSHPNILPLEAVYKLDEATFCFIPLNTGGTLFDVVRGNRAGVPLEQARTYLYHITAALRYLHLDARVAHRDIKLENCLVDTTKGEPGIIRLCDFGMAEWLSNDSFSSPNGSETSSNHAERPSSRNMGPAESSTAAFAGGSLEYAAPEILKLATRRSHDLNGVSAERSIVSPAVDIWAFGVCLYTLLMGKRPFSNPFAPRVVMAILAADWDKEAFSIRFGADTALIELIENCLEPDEKKRWTISEVSSCKWFEEERRNQPMEVRDARAWRL